MTDASAQRPKEKEITLMQYLAAGDLVHGNKVWIQNTVKVKTKATTRHNIFHQHSPPS